MSFFDRIGRLTDAYDGMDDEYYEPGLDDEPLFEEVGEQPSRPARQKKTKPKTKPARRSVFSDSDGYDEPESDPVPVASAPSKPRSAGSPFSRRDSKVVDFKSGTGSSREFVIFRPTRFEEGVSIVDHMKCGRIVLVNEESMTNDEARRITDSLSGAAYALSGNLLRVGSLKAVVFTPHGVALLSDQMDELESSVLQF